MKNIVLSIVSLILAVLAIFSIPWLAVCVFGDVEAACAAIKDSDVYSFGGATMLLVFTSCYFVKLAVDFIIDYISVRKSRPSA